MTKSSLAELLQKKAESYEAEANKNQALIAEWVEAIGKLFEQLQDWLAASDPSKILQVKVSQTEVSEPGLGRYSAPHMEIRAFGKWIGIIPKARKTIKTARPPKPGAPERATGRVDITDEIRRYVLYRFSDDGQDSWVIEDPSSADDAKPLTQKLFEDALTSYLQ